MIPFLAVLDRPLARLLVLAMAPGGLGCGGSDADGLRPTPLERAASAAAESLPAASALGGPESSPTAKRGPATAAERLFAHGATRAPVAAGDLIEGDAVWYGPGFDGKRTACGERFDMSARTAASVVFACGARLRVENLKNGRTVEVRVNDRSGGRTHRLLDLARGAAAELDMLRAGRARVHVTVLSP